MPPKKTAPKTKSSTGGKKTTNTKAAAGASTSKEPQKEEAPLMGTSVALKQINNFLFTPTGELALSGRSAFVTDPSGRSATFMRHRDCNMINVATPQDMDPDKLRLALLGGLRFGKPLVLDFMDLDLNEFWPKAVQQFEQVKKGLMTNILNKEIKKEENYLALVKESDGGDYAHYQFNDDVLQNFAFIAITETEVVPKEFARMFYTVNVE